MFSVPIFTEFSINYRKRDSSKVASRVLVRIRKNKALAMTKNTLCVFYIWCTQLDECVVSTLIYHFLNYSCIKSVYLFQNVQTCARNALRRCISVLLAQIKFQISSLRAVVRIIIHLSADLISISVIYPGKIPRQAEMKPSRRSNSTSRSFGAGSGLLRFQFQCLRLSGVFYISVRFTLCRF